MSTDKLLWEEYLYPHFLETVSGEIYAITSKERLYEELYNLGCRAVSKFRFPKHSLDYKYDLTSEVINEGEEDEYTISYKRPYFIDLELTYNEMDVLVTLMKMAWAENQISSADNFDITYYDTNIKTFSPGNAIDKYLKFYTTFKEEADLALKNYSRVTKEGKPALGSINDED